jgi:hypothetical protein
MLAAAPMSYESQPRGLSMVGPRVSPRSYELLQPVALSMLAAAPMSYESQPRGLSMVGPRVSPRHTPMHTQSALGEPPEAPGAPTGGRATAECSGECGEYCSGARAMLGHLLRRWPLCWQLEQVGVCRLRGVPPRSSTPNFRFVEGGRPRDWRTTGGSARFEKTPLPAECISRRRVIDGATGYSRTLSSSLSVAMSRNICKPWPSHPPRAVLQLLLNPGLFCNFLRSRAVLQLLLNPGLFCNFC